MRKLPQTFAQVTDDFGESEAAFRAFRGLQVIVNRPVMRAGLGKVPSQKFRLCGLCAKRVGFQNFGEAQMECAPPIAQAASHKPRPEPTHA